MNESVVLDDAPSPALPEVLQSIEKIVLERALASCNGNVLSTAKKLGLPRQTLQYKLQKLGLSH
ncbi:helix-turn-helix domain-containing protein [Alicyclobacillus sp. TC]|uniref:helix-turn-helix domain-containing protein n=1 Tax=Alicyclobacillus sp. TC TaxID=2606450 RepID=UPI001932286B|nr:helix-turn-helix domain-containing protein [Alicyclobacillus sp. TC]